MLVEAPIFRGERRLDQVIGKLIERDRVVVSDPARAYFVAIAVEERDGEFGFLQPVIVGGFTEGWDRQRQQDHGAGIAEGETFRERLDEIPAPPAGDMETVHEDREAFVKLASPGLGLVQPKVDAGIEIEQKALQPDLPADPILAALEQVAQGFPLVRGRVESPTVSKVFN